MPCGYEAWQSVKNSRWYWRLKDAYGTTVAEGGGGYGHDSYQACVDEMNAMEECVDARNRNLKVNHISDPNA